MEQQSAPTVLIVEDNRRLRAWLREILEVNGYHVVEAGDGDKALVCVDREQPDLIVLDIFLPGEEGLEIILLLRKRARPVKILAMSGNLIEGYDTCQSAKAFGAQDALAKPFSAEVFLEGVGKLLRQT
jgi:DNA-binding response OmpR family regulator